MSVGVDFQMDEEKFQYFQHLYKIRHDQSFPVNGIVWNKSQSTIEVVRESQSNDQNMHECIERTKAILQELKIDFSNDIDLCIKAEEVSKADEVIKRLPTLDLSSVLVLKRELKGHDKGQGNIQLIIMSCSYDDLKKCKHRLQVVLKRINTRSRGDRELHRPSVKFPTNNNGTADSDERDTNFFTYEQMKVCIHTGSIVEMADQRMCIVNPTNDRYVPTGTVSLALRQKGGEKFERELEKLQTSKKPVCECAVTGAGDLDVTKVVHLVCPSNRLSLNVTKDKKCNRNIFKSVFNCMEAADNANVETIAFPFIYTGKLGQSVKKCCLQYAYAVLEYSRKEFKRETSCLKKVCFVSNKPKDIEDAKSVFQQVLPQSYGQLFRIIEEVQPYANVYVDANTMDHSANGDEADMPDDASAGNVDINEAASGSRSDASYVNYSGPSKDAKVYVEANTMGHSANGDEADMPDDASAGNVDINEAASGSRSDASYENDSGPSKDSKVYVEANTMDHSANGDEADMPDDASAGNVDINEAASGSRSDASCVNYSGPSKDVYHSVNPKSESFDSSEEMSMLSDLSSTESEGEDTDGYESINCHGAVSGRVDLDGKGKRDGLNTVSSFKDPVTDTDHYATINRDDKPLLSKSETKMESVSADDLGTVTKETDNNDYESINEETISKIKDERVESGYKSMEKESVPKDEHSEETKNLPKQCRPGRNSEEPKQSLFSSRPQSVVSQTQSVEDFGGKIAVCFVNKDIRTFSTIALISPIGETGNRDDDCVNGNDLIGAAIKAAYHNTFADSEHEDKLKKLCRSKKTRKYVTLTCCKTDEAERKARYIFHIVVPSFTKTEGGEDRLKEGVSQAFEALMKRIEKVNKRKDVIREVAMPLFGLNDTLEVLDVETVCRTIAKCLCECISSRPSTKYMVTKVNIVNRCPKVTSLFEDAFKNVHEEYLYSQHLKGK